MFAKDVLRVLQVSRPTLTKYVKTGIIRVHVMPNGHYDYNEEDVYKFLNKDVKRKTYIYARVSTPKQKPDLKNQIQLLKQFCFANGYTINGVFSDIASGISFEKRKGLFDLLDDVLAGRVERVVVTYKDRLSRVGYDLFYYLFQKYTCEIVVMLMPCFSHFWNLENEFRSSLTFTMIMVHRISICNFSSGIPIKAATRFMFRSIRFVSAALSINNFPVRSKRSNLRRNNNTSLSVIISFNSYVVLYILAHEDMNLK